MTWTAEEQACEWKGNTAVAAVGASAGGQRSPLHGAVSRPPRECILWGRRALARPPCCQKHSSAGVASELPRNDPCLSQAGFVPKLWSIKALCVCDNLKLLQHVPRWRPAITAAGFTPVQLPRARSVPGFVVFALTEDSRASFAGLCRGKGLTYWSWFALG